MRYRKRPVVIEAFQLTRANRDSNEHWPQWAHAAWNEGYDRLGALYPADGTGALEIHTLEGRMRVSIDDWIIKGVNGELYPCKPDIFAKSYEEVPCPSPSAT
jgi:hypothetical protein